MIIHGRVNRTKYWVLKLLIVAWASGVVGSVPLYWANEYQTRPTGFDVSTFLFFTASILMIPSLVGFILGRFWLANLIVVLLIWNSLSAHKTELQVVLATMTLNAGTMSFLVGWWKLRDFSKAAVQQDLPQPQLD